MKIFFLMNGRSFLEVAIALPCSILMRPRFRAIVMLVTFTALRETIRVLMAKKFLHGVAQLCNLLSIRAHKLILVEFFT